MVWCVISQMHCGFLYMKFQTPSPAAVLACTHLEHNTGQTICSPKHSSSTRITAQTRFINESRVRSSIPGRKLPTLLPLSFSTRLARQNSTSYFLPS